MRRLIVFLVFLVTSVWLGLTVLKHPGYVFVVYQPWMLQMPLWVALLGFIIFFGTFYALIDSVDQLNLWWFRFKNWIQWRREHRAYSKTQHGLALLIEGRWAKAERLLTSGVKNTIDPLMNYLGAARAAQALGAIDRRDTYLRDAHQIAPQAELAIGLTKAELQLEQHQLEQAAATLTRLLSLSPRHPRVLALAEKVYVRLGDWKALQALLPKLRRSRFLSNEQAAQFEKNIACTLLRQPGSFSVNELTACYEQLPRSVRKLPEVMTVYIEALAARGEVEQAASLTRRVLKSTYESRLVTLYASLPLTDVNRELVVAGAWLKSYGPHAELFLLLGKLCTKAQLWGKAKDYFDKCLSLGPNPAASFAYGKLLEQLGDAAAATAIYRNALFDKPGVMA